MPIYEYECKSGHRTQRVVIRPREDEPKDRFGCWCRLTAKLVPSQTGTPILKRGKGGFYKPNA